MNIQAPPSGTAQHEETDGAQMRKHKVLLGVVIVLGVLLIAGFILVIATIVIRVSQSGADGTAKGSGAPAELVEQVVPEGARVQQMMLDNGLLAVHLAGPGGSAGQILVYDVKKRLLLSQIRLGKGGAKAGGGQ